MTKQVTAVLEDETSPLTRKIGYFLGPLLFLLTFVILPPEGMNDPAWKTCGLALWMACWWVTEAMPLPVTSLLPIIILPALHIIPLKEILSSYSSPIIYLMFGGFVISLAMQKCDLHVRIGLGILKIIGIDAKSVLAGVMLATAFMGMWISNTATAIMMLPMAISMATLLCNLPAQHKPQDNYFAKALVLGVAYSCVIGGLSSFVGTPTNAILVGFMEEHYQREMNLADWMRFGIPLALLLLALTWGLLTKLFLGKAAIKPNVREVVRGAFNDLGPMSREERTVTAIFALTATAWIFSPSLESLLGIALDDSVIAVIGAVLLFLTPTSASLDRFPLSWKDTAKLPWGILVFFGGSMSLSAALNDTGVTQWLSMQLSILSNVDIVIAVALLVIVLITVSELMSNVATITAFLPILAATAQAMNIDPLIIMVPATLAASCAFMMPGASAPNALAYGTGYLKIKDMITSGFILNSVALIVITFFTFSLIAQVYKF